MRGVILAGGFGTRMAPSTRVTNKHLLPVYSPAGAVPMLFYPIQTLVKSGIQEILIISSREHCGHIIENLSDGYDFKADFTYKIQDTAHVELGIASALHLAKSFVYDETFAVILGDNYFEETFTEAFQDFATLDPECARNYGFGTEPFGWGLCESAAIFVKEVDDPRRFGVLSTANGKTEIEEKPANPQSNLAVTGLYLYTPHVYEIIKTLKPSGRGELEITDINNFYLQRDKMEVHPLNGYWSDMGTPPSIRRVEEFLANRTQV